MCSVILSKYSGNLLEEGLPITKELLEECLERGILIDATTGNYGYTRTLQQSPTTYRVYYNTLT